MEKTEEQLIQQAIDRMDEVPVSKEICNDCDCLEFLLRHAGLIINTKNPFEFRQLVDLRVVMLN